MNGKTLDWLNSNRYRAYPFADDEGLSPGGVRIPNCILLDFLAIETGHDIGIQGITFTKIASNEDATKIYFTYRNKKHYVTLTGGDVSGPGSFVKMSPAYHTGTGYLEGDNYLSMTLSSHAYIRDSLGLAGQVEWEFSEKILPTRIISVTATGIDYLAVNGSANVPGCVLSNGITGDIHLTDGYRTQPVIQDGKVVINVGTDFGYDPCHYDEQLNATDSDTDSDSESSDDESPCSSQLLFFCGQNAINSGNVTLTGGPGVSISQGTFISRTNVPDSRGNIGIKWLEELPCIEIKATSELLDLYRPTVN